MLKYVFAVVFTVSAPSAEIWSMKGRAFMIKPLVTPIWVTYTPRARIGVLSTAAVEAYRKGCTKTTGGEVVVVTVLDAARLTSSARRVDCCELMTSGSFGSKFTVITAAVIAVPAVLTGDASTAWPPTSTQMLAAV